MTYTKRQKAAAFYKWCDDRAACPEGLKAIKGKTFEDWWATSTNGQYMAWCVYRWGTWGSWSYLRQEMSAALGFQCWLSPGEHDPSERRQMAAYLREYITPPAFLTYHMEGNAAC